MCLLECKMKTWNTGRHYFNGAHIVSAEFKASRRFDKLRVMIARDCGAISGKYTSQTSSRRLM